MRPSVHVCMFIPFNHRTDQVYIYRTRSLKSGDPALFTKITFLYLILSTSNFIVLVLKSSITAFMTIFCFPNSFFFSARPQKRMLHIASDVRLHFFH